MLNRGDVFNFGLSWVFWDVVSVFFNFDFEKDVVEYCGVRWIKLERLYVVYMIMEIFFINEDYVILIRICFVFVVIEIGNFK